MGIGLFASHHPCLLQLQLRSRALLLALSVFLGCQIYPSDVWRYNICSNVRPDVPFVRRLKLERRASCPGMGNLSKAVGRGMSRPVFGVLQLHFALANNVGDVSAKEEVKMCTSIPQWKSSVYTGQGHREKRGVQPRAL